MIPGNKNCDIRNIHWLELTAKNLLTKEAKKNPNILYYETESSKFEKRRLITTGLNGLVIEWDFKSMTPKSKYSCNSAIWDSKMHGKYIYLACEDGTVKILKIKKGKIEFVRSLYKAEARCLSLELLTNGIDENTMVKGLFSAYSDSSFRKWDLSSGNSILHF